MKRLLFFQTICIQIPRRPAALGEYLIQHLVPDHYVMHVEAPGFTAAETTGVELEADSSPRFDFSFKTGGTEQIIQVRAEAPQLQTDQAEVSTTLNGRSIQDLRTPRAMRPTLRSCRPARQRSAGIL